MYKEDILGKRFGKLVVKKFSKCLISSDKRGSKRYIFECVCDCGNTTYVQNKCLLGKITKSCGCLMTGWKDLATTHGESKTLFYQRWEIMKTRILNKNHTSYPRYGGNGVTLCESWKTYLNFKQDMYESFIKHLKIYGKNQTTIDRIDNSKGYSKQNCRWATRKQQVDNRVIRKFINYKNKMLTRAELARQLGLSQCSINGRIKSGWSTEELTLPKFENNKRRKGR